MLCISKPFQKLREKSLLIINFYVVLNIFPVVNLPQILFARTRGFSRYVFRLSVYV